MNHSTNHTYGGEMLRAAREASRRPRTDTELVEVRPERSRPEGLWRTTRHTCVLSLSSLSDVCEMGHWPMCTGDVLHGLPQKHGVRGDTVNVQQLVPGL